MKLFTVSNKRVLKALTDLEPKVAKAVIRKSIREAIKPIKVATKALAPVDTGVLKKAIKIKAGKRKKGMIYVSVEMGEGDFKGDVFYGSFLEYGTSKIKPRGFMRRAADEHGPEALKTAVELMWAGIKAAWKSS